MENRTKEQPLDLFADRTSAGMPQANQLRLWFSSLAYVLEYSLRRVAVSRACALGRLRGRVGAPTP